MSSASQAGMEGPEGFFSLPPGHERHLDKWSQALLLLDCTLLKCLPRWLTTGISFHHFQVMILKHGELQPLGSPSPFLPLHHQVCKSGLPAACTGWVAVGRCLSKPCLSSASRSKILRASKKLLFCRDALARSN